MYSNVLKFPGHAFLYHAFSFNTLHLIPPTSHLQLHTLHLTPPTPYTSTLNHTCTVCSTGGSLLVSVSTGDEEQITEHQQVEGNFVGQHSTATFAHFQSVNGSLFLEPATRGQDQQWLGGSDKYGGHTYMYIPCIEILIDTRFWAPKLQML